MVKKRKPQKKGSSRMPPTGVGLMTFLDEKTGGPEVRPELVIGLALAFIALSIIALVFFKTA
jgi:preprotein translocase subunit Sec61beta